MWRRAFELKSLEDVWQTLIVTLIQLVCMWRAFDRIGKYSGSAAWLPFQRPLAQLALYVVCLTASVCLLPIMVWSGLCRIGVYANDRFKFGVDLDTERIVKSEFKKRANVSPAATASSRQRRHRYEYKSRLDYRKFSTFNVLSIKIYPVLNIAKIFLLRTKD